jgi:type I restriction enzyme, S subunit
VLRAANDVVPDFLFYKIWNSSFRELGAQNMTGSAGQKRVPADFLKRLEIHLPPLNEQRRIAAILDKADAMRRKRKRSLDLVASLKQSIFSEMFGDPIENTKQLPVVALENVVSPTRKITYGILKPGPDHAGGIPYVRVVDIRNSLIDVTGLKRTTNAIACEYKRSTIREGDLLISIRGHVGRMAITPPECDGANITQDTARLAITAANTEFVKAQLETDPAKHWMIQRTKGAAVKGINLGDLRQFPLILPPRPLQDEFAEKVSMVRAMLEKSSRQHDGLDVLFSSLQHRAFSGQL